jgi:hypothetical protein
VCDLSIMSGKKSKGKSDTPIAQWQSTSILVNWEA